MALRKLVILSLCLLVAPLCLGGQSHCTIQQLQGKYVGTFSGYTYLLPFTTLGTITVASNGDTISKITLTSAMGTSSNTALGKWTVDPDCTLSTTVYLGSVEYRYRGVVLDNGSEIQMLQVQPVLMQGMPMTSSGTFYRLTPGANEPYCSAQGVKGRYAQRCTGWKFVAPGAPPMNLPLYLPTAVLGTIWSAGESVFAGNATMAFGGQTIPLVYQNASVVINPDCTGTATFGFAGIPGTFTQQLAILEHGKAMISISTLQESVEVCHFTRMDR